MARKKNIAPVVKSVVQDAETVVERAIVRFSHIVLQFTVENGTEISYEVLETLDNAEVADAIEYATVRFSQVVCQFVVTDGTNVHAYELEPEYREIGGGPTPPEPGPTPIYTLAETSFDGSNKVETNVSLLDADKDFTVAIKYMTTTRAGNPLYCFSGNAQRGLAITWVSITPYLRACYAQQAIDRSEIDQNKLIKMVITHNIGDTFCKFQFVTDNDTVIKSYDVGTALYDIQASKLTFGESMIGTIYDAAVYEEVVDNDFINNYLLGGE